MHCNGLTRTLMLSSVLSAAMLAASPSFADIDTPQGALDIAAIVPGRYGPLAEEGLPPAPKSGVDDLLELMRISTERGAAQMVGAPAHAVKDLAGEQARALDIAASVPKNAPKPKETKETKAPQSAKSASRDALAMVKGREFLWPVSGSIYSAFNATRGKRMHGAIDIVAPKGTPVAAASSGTVIVVANGGKNYRGYGKIVIIDHGAGVHTAYAHLDSYSVKVGQRVNAGQTIGRVGRTGSATTNLLHYEVRINGKKIDPLLAMEHRPGALKMTDYKSSSPARKSKSPAPAGTGSRKKKK